MRAALFTATVALLAAVVVAIGFAGRDSRPAAAIGPAPSVDLAGLTYQFEGARGLFERGDARVLHALPRRVRDVGAGHALFAVFLSITNSGSRAAPAARRFELLDLDGGRYRQVPLAATSAFAYRTRSLGPGQRAPRNGSPPSADIADSGYPIVFVIPRAVLKGRKTLTLRIFDPTRRAFADLLVQT